MGKIFWPNDKTFDAGKRHERKEKKFPNLRNLKLMIIWISAMERVSIDSEGIFA